MPKARRRALADLNSIVTRTWLKRRVLSGHSGGSRDSVLEVRLVVEARHLVVRLRLEVGALDAALGFRHEERQASAGDEIANERGDEDGLAGTGQPGDAEPQRGRHHVGQQGAGAMPSLARWVVQIGNGLGCGQGGTSQGSP